MTDRAAYHVTASLWNEVPVCASSAFGKSHVEGEGEQRKKKKKRLPDEDGSEKNGRRSVGGGSTFVKVAGFCASSSSSRLFFSQLSGFCERRPTSPFQKESLFL